MSTRYVLAVVGATVASYLAANAQVSPASVTLTTFYTSATQAAPLDGTEVMLVVQAGAIKQVPLSQVTSIRVQTPITVGGCPTWVASNPPTIGSSAAGCLLAQ